MVCFGKRGELEDVQLEPKRQRQGDVSCEQVGKAGARLAGL